MMKKYSQEITISCYDTDASKLLKPASFMNLAQEEANRHAEILGFGYDDLMASRTAWVLSRMHIKFLRHPSWREKVTLDTWHKGQERLFYLRDFIMKDTEGNPVVLATTSWLVLNMDTRRLVREVLLSEDGVCTENAVEKSCDKVSVPPELEKTHVMTHVVSYSDVDMNGHANNAMYIVWAMDAAGYDIAAARPVSEVRINFNHETRPGDHVEIYRAETCAGGADIVYIEGIVNGQSAFCTQLVFRK